MKPISHHINTVKAQPHHIRKQVAFAAAIAVAGVIGIVWAGVSLATNAFAIKGSSFADSTAAKGGVAATGGTGSLTAAAANAGDSQGPARIQIVGGTQASAPVAPATQPTSISF